MLKAKQLLLPIVCTASLLAISSQAHSAILFDTTQSPIPVDFSHSIANGENFQSVIVPAGETWTLTSLKVDVGDGSQANFGINIFDSGNTLVGSSEQVAFSSQFAFVQYTLNFSSPLVLESGTYSFADTWQVTGVDSGSFWVTNPELTGGDGSTSYAYDLQINGTSVSAAVPEPGTWLSGLALLSMSSFARRRKVA